MEDTGDKGSEYFSGMAVLSGNGTGDASLKGPVVLGPIAPPLLQ